MYPEKDHFHYTKEEIRGLFKEYLDAKNWQINESEYNQLCKLISCLSVDLVDLLRTEIQVVIYGEQKDKNWDDHIIFACYLNLRDEQFLSAKKGIIFLSPEFLDKEKGHFTLLKLCHELAHHKLDHRTVKTENEVAMNEEAANKMASVWYGQETHHLEDC
jgi:hypothetical protein